MNTRTDNSGASALPDERAERGIVRVPQPWRAITWRQWLWTTVIALLLLLASSTGLLPPLLNVVPSVAGPQLPSWNVAKSVGAVLVHIFAAYCFLLAIRIAETGTPNGRPPVQRYVIAGLCALGAALTLEIVLYVSVPSLARRVGGLPLLLESNKLAGTLVWSAANFGLIGGLALAVYVRFRSARLARDAFNAAEYQRVAARREVLATRLAAMQARVEPRFLLGTLMQVEALYDCDPKAGDLMLDGLIAYLHAALPQLRSPRSTLGQEVQLADSYLRVVRIRMGSRLECRIEVDPGLEACDFPPMVLLPLIDEALRNGLEPMPQGGAITIIARAAGKHLRVQVSDNGLPRDGGEGDDRSAIAVLLARIRGLYGKSALFEMSAGVPQGVITAIEVPLVDARHPC